MATKFARVVAYFEGLFPIKSNGSWGTCFVRSRDKLETYLHYHNLYGQQTWHGGNIQ